MALHTLNVFHCHVQHQPTRAQPLCTYLDLLWEKFAGRCHARYVRSSWLLLKIPLNQIFIVSIEGRGWIGIPVEWRDQSCHRCRKSHQGDVRHSSAIRIYHVLQWHSAFCIRQNKFSDKTPETVRSTSRRRDTRWDWFSFYWPDQSHCQIVLWAQGAPYFDAP